MKYRKKPVTIEAVQWIPNERGSRLGGWPKSKAWAPAKKWLVSSVDLSLYIPTLEGEMKCKPGDYVIKGVRGEFYSCREDIFNETYEKVEEK